MIVFEDRKLVIVTPPHTASGNVHRACCGTLGARWAIGPTPDGAGFDHHVARLSNDWLDYRVAVVVRHPVERLVGLYEHHQYLAKEAGWEPLAWWQFVAMVLERHRDLSWFYTSTICELIGPLKVDFVLRHEHLADDLRDFVGADVSLPAREWERDWGPYLATPVTCLLAEHWGEADMLRFGFASRFKEFTRAV